MKHGATKALCGGAAAFWLTLTAFAAPAKEPANTKAPAQSDVAGAGQDPAEADATPAQAEPTPAAQAEPTPAAQAEPTPAAQAEPTPVTSEPLAPQHVRPEAIEIGPSTTIDTTLPSGVRVLVARDDSLPVAAVILAVEVGSEDDPEPLPGLNHALAFALLQGNREFAPSGIADMVHDAGGVTSLATGPAQTRFESLVPVTLLADVIAAEAGRLRAPTIADTLWADALTWARRDPARAWGVPHAVLSRAHGVAGLGHPGRAVSPPLQKLTAKFMSLELARRFAYERSTLVVVAPHATKTTLKMVEQAFADLPTQTRVVPDRRPRTGERTAPLSLEVPGADGRTFVWPIDPDPASRAWAKVWCKTLNRQRRKPGEHRAASVRCRLDEDPRRPVLIVRSTGTADPGTSIEGRVARIAGGTDDRLLRQQVDRVRSELRQDRRLPLGFARALATSGLHDAAPVGAPLGVSGDALIGLGALEDNAPPVEVEVVLAPGRAIRLRAGRAVDSNKVVKQ